MKRLSKGKRAHLLELTHFWKLLNRDGWLTHPAVYITAMIVTFAVFVAGCALGWWGADA